MPHVPKNACMTIKLAMLAQKSSITSPIPILFVPRLAGSIAVDDLYRMAPLSIFIPRRLAVPHFERANEMSVTKAKYHGDKREMAHIPSEGTWLVLLGVEMSPVAKGVRSPEHLVWAGDVPTDKVPLVQSWVSGEGRVRKCM